MNKEKLSELIEFAKTTDLTEVIWEKKGTSIRFRRSVDAKAPASAHEPRATTARKIPAFGLPPYPWE